MNKWSVRDILKKVRVPFLCMLVGGCMHSDNRAEFRGQAADNNEFRLTAAQVPDDKKDDKAREPDKDDKDKEKEKDKKDKSAPGKIDWSRVPIIDLFAKPKAPPPPVDSVIIRPDGVVQDKQPEKDSAKETLAGAHELFRQKQYSKAESVFRRIADNTKNPVAICEEARFYQAECLRLDGYLPRAADTYNDLLNKFPHTAYREQATQRMFDIANYWLDDTRTEMEETREKREGKRWFVMPRFISFEKKKPLLDREGRAIEKLEQVRYHDINGPLADKALFMAGSVKFFNEDYREADFLFSQIHEKHPNSPLAPKAVELAIVSKHLSTGGSDYDGRKVAEARKLVQSAMDNYPELASQKQDFLLRQIVNITFQQAEKDYKIAEFYKRTGHPGSAYFYFEIVRRRYPNTKFAELAAGQMNELRDKLEKDKDGGEEKVNLREKLNSLGAAPRQSSSIIPRTMMPGRDGSAAP